MRNGWSTRSWQRQDGSSLELQREQGPSDTLISDFWPPEL